MKKAFSYFLILTIQFIALTAWLHANPATEAISLIARYPVSPILKGIEYNTLLRVAVYVPAGNHVSFKSMNCSLNADALNKIKKLEVFYSGAEPFFADDSLLARPDIARSLQIPINISLQPGWHYLWFSATLKDDADIDGTINFQCKHLTDSSGKMYPLGAVPHKQKMGIAIRKAGDHNVHTYRIPGITRTNTGTLVAVYDIRYNHSGDLPANVDVGMSRSTDGGKTWEPMKIIMDMGPPHENNGIGDPAILFDTATKTIWVASLWSKGNRSIAGSGPGLSPEETGQFMLAKSEDDGITWSQPINITAQVKDPAWRLFFEGPGNGICMKNGTLVFPAQFWDAQSIPHATIIYSDDHGRSWKRGTGAKANTTESQVVETKPGTLMLNMRDNRGEFRSVATTEDMGATWVEHRTSYNALKDPVCMAGFTRAAVSVRGSDMDVLFFSNCNSSVSRHDITLKASLDLGETWKESHKLLIDERTTFGYSALTKIDDRTMGVIYEGVRDLYFVRIPVKDVLR